MGMMNKMREQTGVVLWILVLSFGGLWVLQDSGAFDVIGLQQGRSVGTVNGQDISSEMYRNAIDQRLQSVQQQGMDVTPNMQAQIEQEVWDALVVNALREQEMERLGIEVSRDEIYELITGDNPAPIVRQAFPDGNGGVDRALLNDIIAQAEDNPEIASQLVALEEQIGRTRRQQKLNALIAASVRVAPREIEREFTRRNRTASADYVALRYSDVPDEQVNVSERDIEAYYDENRDDFERPTLYSVDYVTFSKAPTAADSALALRGLRELRQGFREASDPVSFAQQNSFGAESEATLLTPPEMAPELATALYEDPGVGRVVGPLATAEGQVALLRITAVQQAENGPFTRARHILFSAEAEAQAVSVKQEIESGALSFEQAARQYSTDNSNSAQGGDLGWFGSGQMVPAFDEAVQAASVGDVVGPIETQFGLHLLRVESRVNQAVEVVRISRPLTAQLNEVRQAAEEFQFFTVEEDRDFAEAAQQEGLTVQQAQVQAGQPFVPGLNIGRDLFRFLEGAEAGDISQPLDAGDALAVVRLKETQPEGYRPLEEVRGQIESRLLTEKKKDVQIERLRQARSAGSLTAIAQQAGTSVQSASELTLAAPTLPGFGREPRVLGALFGLQPNSISQVIEGRNAVFVLRPTAFTGGDSGSMTPQQREEIRQQLLQQKRQQLLRSWLQDLRDEAEIEDFRNQLQI